jgi:hypothetical protein
VTEPEFDINMYFDALDEIWLLRRALAYEAAATAAHLSYKSFPKSRREVAENQIERMRESARGRAQPAYSGVHTVSLRSAMEAADAPTTFTRHDWELSRAWRRSGAHQEGQR